MMKSAAILLCAISLLKSLYCTIKIFPDIFIRTESIISRTNKKVMQFNELSLRKATCGFYWHYVALS